MDFSSCKKIIIFLFFPCLFYVSNATGISLPGYSTAFYYGSTPPPQLRFYRNVIFQPNNHPLNPQQFNNKDRTAYAYVSLGEVEKSQQIPAKWVIGKNPAWDNNLVMDQTNTDWQKYVMSHYISPLWEQGYRGFFFDTLDSYQLAVHSKEERLKQQQGLVAIIQTVKTKYPEAKILLNRGFEFLPQVKSLINGVVAESLFNSWNNKTLRYELVKETERKELLRQLNAAKALGLPVTIIDYLNPQNTAQATELAQKIKQLGFDAWITDKNLSENYFFNIPLLPRKILMLYSGRPGNIDDKSNSEASTRASFPLNHLGYVIKMYNLNEELPENISNQEYAGIVVLLQNYNNQNVAQGQRIHSWILAQIKKNIPVVFFNNFGFPMDNLHLSAFGLSKPLFISPSSHLIKITHHSSMMGYESKPIFNNADFSPLKIEHGKSLLTLSDELGATADVAGIMPWGGYVLSPFSYIQSPLVESFYIRWVINPMEFLKQALRLPDQPIPDITSENGRRLMFAHIDGDGFANRAEWAHGPFTGDVMMSDILEKYKLPVTVSIVQGEVASNGLYPKLTPELEKIAKKIFALPYVEIASHTYSHAFNWQNALSYKGDGLNPYTLPIPNYKFNLKTEIDGSVNYINTVLAPKGKMCRVFLWSGEGDVNEEALKLTYQLHIGNLNGGKTRINQFSKTIAEIAPLGIYQGPYFQVFAPIANDFELTSEGLKSQYEFVHVIDTLRLTGEPERLKPIDIYYHFYSAQQKGGIKALRMVYDWALSHPVFNIYASDYIKNVLDFNSLAIAKIKGGWLLETGDNLREMRIPKEMGFPDLNNSSNIIGYNAYSNSYYIHIGPSGEALLKLSKFPPTIPYLNDSNAKVLTFNRVKNGIDFSLLGNSSTLQFSFNNMQRCAVWDANNKLTPKTQSAGLYSYEFSGTEHAFSIKCT